MGGEGWLRWLRLGGALATHKKVSDEPSWAPTRRVLGAWERLTAKLGRLGNNHNDFVVGLSWSPELVMTIV